MYTKESKEELALKAFSELRGYKFNIPYQQRGYKWTKTNVYELLCDLKAFIHSNKRVYCLQPLAVVDKGNGSYSVLDGQQRLTTLFLLYSYLFGKAPYKFSFERDKRESMTEACSSMEEMDRSEYLSKIATISEKEANENIDFFFIYHAYQIIKKTFEDWSDKDNERDCKEQFKDLLNAGKDKNSIQVIWYKVPNNEEKEHETFRNLNSGKIQLTNTELIKALLLNSGIPSEEQEEVAAQFEHIEQEMQNDHFWYMFNKEDVRQGQTRMDILFNLASNCKQVDYNIDPRWSFRNYFGKDSEETLSQKWKKVRETFLRLKDMYNDIYNYHYIGFLTYCHSDITISSLLKDNREQNHGEFRKELREKIKKILQMRHDKVTDYTFYDSPQDIRQLFLMHNIETILQKYELLRKNEELQLQHNFEQFPFELLYKQSWDIEHIASQTDSKFKNDIERKDWLDSIKQD